jgi:hypothetical protein
VIEPPRPRGQVLRRARVEDRLTPLNDALRSSDIFVAFRGSLLEYGTTAGRDPQLCVGYPTLVHPIVFFAWAIVAHEDALATRTFTAFILARD